jgi:hypothetical protein
MTSLLEEAEFREAVDVLCSQIIALPVDDEWLPRIREVANRVVSAIATSGGDMFTSQTFEAMIVEAHEVVRTSKLGPAPKGG